MTRHLADRPRVERWGLGTYHGLRRKHVNSTIEMGRPVITTWMLLYKIKRR
jgi:hypothetical protein